MNFMFVLLFAFLGYGFWLLSRSFLNSFYDAPVWDRNAINDFLGASVSVACAAASTVAMVRYALFVVL